LLYRMRTDGCSPQIFHDKCDDKGPTLTLVHANGYVFGGFNPTSWISEYAYSESEDAFLFSISEPSGQRPPFKCPVKKGKADVAIKQSEKEYSPGFGEANICDLFIAFKNLEKSYSNLGNAYLLPF